MVLPLLLSVLVLTWRPICGCDATNACTHDTFLGVRTHTRTLSVPTHSQEEIAMLNTHKDMLKLARDVVGRQQNEKE